MTILSICATHCVPQTDLHFQKLHPGSDAKALYWEGDEVVACKIQYSKTNPDLYHCLSGCVNIQID